MKKGTSIIAMLVLTFVMTLSVFTLETKAYAEPIDYTREVYLVDTFEELKAACEATKRDRTIIFENDIEVGYDDFVSAGSSENYMGDYQINIKGDTAVLIDLQGHSYKVLSRNTNFVFAVREKASLHFINSHPTVQSYLKFDVNNDPVHGGVGINYENTTALVNVDTEGGFYSDNVHFSLGEFDLSELASNENYITNPDKRVTNIFLKDAKEAVMTSGTVNNVYSNGRGIHINSEGYTAPDFPVELSNMSVKAGGYAICSSCSESLTLNHMITLQSYATEQCMFTLSTGDMAKVATILGRDRLDDKTVVYSVDRNTALSADTDICNLGALAYFIYEGNAMPDLNAQQQDTSMILPHGHVMRFSYNGMWYHVELHSFELDEDGHAYCRCGYNAKYEVILDKESYEYDGTAKEPVVTLKIGAIEIDSSIYDVEYENNVEIGNATVKIVPIQNSTFIKKAVSKAFEITPKVIQPTIELSNSTYVYNGQVQTPTVTVKNGSEVLPASSYIVTYPAGMTNVGTYEITVTLQGIYSGTASATYTITQAPSKPVEDKPVAITPTIQLAKTKYVYNGKVQKPTVTVKNGDTVLSSSDYEVTFPNGCKNVGKYVVTVTLKGKYTGTATAEYVINPKATSLKKLKAGKKSLTVTWKKLTSQTTGYEIQYSTSSKFKSAKKVTVTKNKTTKKTIKKLKAKKKYYVRIRTYKTVKVNGKNTKFYSDWSKSKSIKVK